MYTLWWTARKLAAAQCADDVRSFILGTSERQCVSQSDACVVYVAWAAQTPRAAPVTGPGAPARGPAMLLGVCSN